MEIIGGRTPEQWRAYDRWRLVVAVVLVALLLLLWLIGAGPGRAAACCSTPAPLAAAVTPLPAAPPALPSEAEAPPAQTLEADCPETIDVDVRFSSTSHALESDTQAVLDGLGPCLAQGRFVVSGHADSSGGDSINVPLAEARARSVADYLVSRGVDGARLSTEAFGSSRPIADNGTVEGREQNRRVEITAQ